MRTSLLFFLLRTSCLISVAPPLCHETLVHFRTTCLNKHNNLPVLKIIRKQKDKNSGVKHNKTTHPTLEKPVPSTMQLEAYQLPLATPFLYSTCQHKKKTLRRHFFLFSWTFSIFFWSTKTTWSSLRHHPSHQSIA